ncbi:MAG: MBL fold metallo-hydrolase [Lachnospiraceae bacterium]|nr:MBL fold metallo-hydrolase [Lachnospiraceae bacterium]
MASVIHELKYSNTNTYLIEGSRGRLLFDTGWAGTFAQFCKCLGELDISVQSIDHILISHFHPDHMGIAQEIADMGAVITVVDVQRDFIHSSDHILAKEPRLGFRPIEDDKVRVISITDSRDFLAELGLDGELIHTPGHSDDSISLWLDDGSLFVGDLNPLYELEAHKDSETGKSWEKLLSLTPAVVYYGHARTAYPDQTGWKKDNRRSDFIHALLRIEPKKDESKEAIYRLVQQIMHLIDKGAPLDRIQSKTGADATFIEDVARMYLTHRNVGVQGILDRIEIKGR